MFDSHSTNLIVFSHPNHELAVFGFLQRARPHLVYLTDGGGPDRVAQTIRGLESIGLSENASFLDHTEASFYEALLERDSEFLEEVAGEVRAIVNEAGPQRVFCDAVEFYNPIHDLSLPIVKNALSELPERPVFEVPLVYQRVDERERYEVQRLPRDLQDQQVTLELSKEELDRKLHARDSIYTLLLDQMGTVISDLLPQHMGTEVAMPARESIAGPGPHSTLRYERRARLLAEKGEIQREITFAQHYLPVASTLLTFQRHTLSVAGS